MMDRLRQPRLADLVAADLRNAILSGKLPEGDVIPRQEELIEQYRVSLPAVREALRILESEGLITVRRGNLGGAVVRTPTPERAAQMISMVLQARRTTAGDLTEALLHLEPLCARLCAARSDRATQVVPHLQAALDRQISDFGDPARFNENARRFHEILVSRCGNETLQVVIGSLEAIWSSHHTSVWGEARQHHAPIDPESPMAEKSQQAALRAHKRLLAVIASGDTEKSASLALAHLDATRFRTFNMREATAIVANVVVGADTWLA